MWRIQICYEIFRKFAGVFIFAGISICCLRLEYFTLLIIYLIMTQYFFAHILIVMDFVMPDTLCITFQGMIKMFTGVLSLISQIGLFLGHH